MSDVDGQNEVDSGELEGSRSAPAGSLLAIARSAGGSEEMGKKRRATRRSELRVKEKLAEAEKYNGETFGDLTIESFSVEKSAGGSGDGVLMAHARCTCGGVRVERFARIHSASGRTNVRQCVNCAAESSKASLKKNKGRAITVSPPK